MRPALLILVLVTAVNADRVQREFSRLGMRQVGIEIDSGQFNEAHLDRVARTELMRKPRVGFLQISLYGRGGGAPLPKPDHVTYEYWRGLYNQMEKSEYEVAEVTAVGDDVVLRRHSADGRVTRKVLAGRDPLQLAVAGQDFEIVYFAFSAPSLYIAQRVDVYIRTGAILQPESGLELLRMLRPVFPGLQVSVVVRNDAWFVGQSTYPFVNPFIEDQRVPSAVDYNKTRTLICGSLSSDQSCRFE